MNYKIEEINRIDLYCYVIEKNDYKKFLNAVNKQKKLSIEHKVNEIFEVKGTYEVYIIEDGLYTCYYGSPQKYNLEKVSINKGSYLITELNEFDGDVLSFIDKAKECFKEDENLEDYEIDYHYIVIEKIDDKLKVYLRVK